MSQGFPQQDFYPDREMVWAQDWAQILWLAHICFCLQFIFHGHFSVGVALLHKMCEPLNPWVFKWIHDHQHPDYPDHLDHPDDDVQLVRVELLHITPL